MTAFKERGTAANSSSLNRQEVLPTSHSLADSQRSAGGQPERVPSPADPTSLSYEEAQAQKRAIETCFRSDFPMAVWWGREFQLFFNDAWQAQLGQAFTKVALPGQQAWSEAWDILGKELETVVRTGQACWVTDQWLPLKRGDICELACFTYSHTPVWSSVGTVVGVTTALQETTERVLAARRSRTLTCLTAHLAEASSLEAVYQESLTVIGENSEDLPFTQLFLWDSHPFSAVLRGETRQGRDATSSVSDDLQKDLAEVWQLWQVQCTGKPILVENIGAYVEAVCCRAIVMPVKQDDRAIGAWVFGIHDRLPLDAAYQEFLDAITQQCTSAAARFLPSRSDSSTATAETSTRLFPGLSAARMVAWEYDLRTGQVTWSSSPEAVLEMPPNSLSQHANQLLESVHPDDRVRVEQAIQNACYHGDTYEVEFRLCHPDGSIVWVYDQGIVQRDSQNEPIRMVGVCLNISDRKQAELAVQESERRFRTLADAAPVLIWISAVDRLCNYFNLTWLTFTGRTLEQESGNGWTEGVHPEDLSRCLEVYTTAFDRREPFSMEYRLRRYDGEYRWILDVGVPLFDSNGNFAGYIGSGIDITDRKHAEEERESILRSMIEANPVGMLLGDVYGNVKHANDAFLKIIGYTREDLELGRIRWTELTPPEYVSIDRERVAQARKTGVSGAYEKEYLRPDGTRVPVLIGYTLFDSQREQSAAFILDLTERKQAEQERDRLLQSERRARETAEAANRVKDEFLAVLSHELRSPLNPILGWAQLLRSRSFDADRMDRGLEIIERNARLQTQLIEDLLDISRILRGKMTLTVTVVNLVKVIENAMETVRLAAEAKGIAMRFTIGGGTDSANSRFTIRGDVGRLQQIVWNLLSNAVKFTPEKGHIVIRLRQRDSIAEVQVEDDGQGITPEFLPHVFEYFRQADGTITRKFGGLGLGLAIVHHLVEQHGGTIRAESAGEGQGATFTIQLPLLQEDAPASNELNSPASQLNSQRLLEGVHVLMVDDDPDLRELSVVTLEAQGARVSTSASAAEALFLMDQQVPTVLVSDIGMPEVDGYMLIRQVRRRSPENGGTIPAIALTAYASEGDQLQVLAAGFQEHVAKPVDPEALVRAIVKVVAQQSETTLQ